ncbi:hypothetical protein SAPIO_CDS2201 [Scedosporium apiospermum]|uniref:Uncharacterized protein n=1 Tax=Pseudallescheria apiosperma TaxID=563466 RepID=A0A084GDG0_PSEDA|nr:uncharacterized protein SAPIO_CDS2201 [Scedosporium apiospermum]KEZ45372.1 hypothetical protein SAPIO_CDS2201 [Scedosporium apiospermum]
MAVGNLTAPEIGCTDLIKACREAAAVGDPESVGDNGSVNEPCVAASTVCFGIVQGAYTEVSNRNAFDISLIKPSVYPPEYSFAFFNQRRVKEDLGAPVNFSISDPNVVQTFFGTTDDPMRRDISSLEHVLNSGLIVAMYYVIWITGVTGLVSKKFRSGWNTPDLLRSGPPAFHIFDLAMGGKDVATGQLNALESYKSEGPPSVRHVTAKAPESLAPVCYVFDIQLTCTPNQIQALADGSAVVHNFIVVEPRAESG